jgi:hypothetical protein
MLEHRCQDNKLFIYLFIYSNLHLGNDFYFTFSQFFPNLPSPKKKNRLWGTIPQNKMPTTLIEDWVVISQASKTSIDIGKP